VVQQRFALLWGRGAYGVYKCKGKNTKNTNSYFLLMAGDDGSDDGRCGVAVAVVLRVCVCWAEK